jgi:hypothetical protein
MSSHRKAVVHSTKKLIGSIVTTTPDPTKRVIVAEMEWVVLLLG